MKPFQCLVLALGFHCCQAHRSLPAGITCGSQFSNASDPLVIPNPDISWASYRLLTCDAPIFWLSAQMKAQQTINFTVGAPKLQRFASARLTTVIMGPGLPLNADTIDPDGTKQVPQEIKDELRKNSGFGAMIFESPEDQTSCNHAGRVMIEHVEVMDNRCVYYEPFGGSYSYLLADVETRAQQEGLYKIALYNKAGTAAKAWFACCDWPEDFTTAYQIPQNECPYCGTRADSNPSWSSYFYEQKGMANYSGFPTVATCGPTGTPEPTEGQCPPVARKTAQSNPDCVLHCSSEKCHSHNVDGGCIFDIDWKIPKPTLPSTGASVQEIVLFKGDSVRMRKADQFAHNIYEFSSVDEVEKCAFANAQLVADTEETTGGYIAKLDQVGTFSYACRILCDDNEQADDCHCKLGQKLIITVKDPADGRQCHSHEFSMPPPPALECKQGEVARHAIGDDTMFGCNLAAQECAQICIPQAMLSFVESSTEAGTCHSAGYPIETDNRQAVTNPMAPPTAFSVFEMQSNEPCHCHSYEEIICNTTGDALYDEHIVEIQNYCGGVIDNSTKICPYNCFQPFEVLHLHYLECDFRQKHPLFVQIEKTELCHLAKRSKDGSECGRAIVSTSKASTSGCGATTESAPTTANSPTDQKCEPIAQLNIETIMVHAIKGSAKKYGATSDQCSQFCAAKPWIPDDVQEGSCVEFDTHVETKKIKPDGSPVEVEVSIYKKNKPATTTSSTEEAVPVSGAYHCFISLISLIVLLQLL